MSLIYTAESHLPCGIFAPFWEGAAHKYHFPYAPRAFQSTVRKQTQKAEPQPLFHVHAFPIIYSLLMNFQMIAAPSCNDA